MASLRKNKIKIKIVPRYLFIVMVVICLILLLVSYRFSDSLGPVKTAVGDVITPMPVGINKGKYELDDFRKLYNLDQTYADYPKVAARVISKGTNNWYSEFKIDKGSDDGIKPGMNVMAGNGLVGIITKVGRNNSMVRSIIDDSSYVMGMLLDTSDTCVVKGNLKLLDEGHIEVTDIKKGAEVKDGYEVVTSYISPKYHPGILIGYISDIKVDPSNMTESGYLTPAVDFSKLDMVLIITREKEEEENLN